jgi:hypothetical protein
MPLEQTPKVNKWIGEAQKRGMIDKRGTVIKKQPPTIQNVIDSIAKKQADAASGRSGDAITIPSQHIPEGFARAWNTPISARACWASSSSSGVFSGSCSGRLNLFTGIAPWRIATVNGWKSFR